MSPITRKFLYLITAINIGLLFYLVTVLVIRKDSSSDTKYNLAETLLLSYPDFSESDSKLPPENFEPNNELKKPPFTCDDITPRTYYAQHGPSYWVLFNYIKASRTFACDESITYSTHGDHTFLRHLVPLVKRWKGPVSIAVYAPGNDFEKALQEILYLRECTSALESQLIKMFVTFHLFFDQKHIGKGKTFSRIPKDPEELLHLVNCTAHRLPSKQNTYRKISKLQFPINIARNIARQMSTTHFVLSSDVELYPNPSLIDDFLNMIHRNNSVYLDNNNSNNTNPKVYVVPVFEVEKGIERLPETKFELIQLLDNNTAYPFHIKRCSRCHNIPNYSEWKNSNTVNSTELNVFRAVKRTNRWEPFLISTKTDPLYDERLSWEGQGNKMTQAYIICVLDYDLLILDNAYLIHHPGVKSEKPEKWRINALTKQRQVIKNDIFKELTVLYGKKYGCKIFW